jgi:PST family polysaccharide transporter
MGGAQVITLLASFVRGKIVAVLLGPAGIGLFGVLSSFNANLSALGGWGIGISGVRAIASAEDEERDHKVFAVRRFAGWLAAGSMLLIFIIAWPVSLFTFKSSQYALQLIVAGLAVPLIIIASAYSSLFQANGEITKLAKIQAVGAISGLLIGAPLIWIYGEYGVALSIVMGAAVPAYLSWTAARHAGTSRRVEVRGQDIRSLISLGGALMASSLLAQASAYFARLLIIRQLGLAEAGHFHAANTIAMSLPGIVLVSMGTDFFPKVASAKCEKDARQLTELQIRTVLLLSLPLVSGLLTLGNVCIRVVYAEGFEPAAAIMPWMIWGVFFRLIAWPMGYWLLGRGSAKLMIGVDVATNMIAGLLPALLLPRYGLVGSAAAFLLGCIAYAVVLIFAVRWKTGGWIGFVTLCWATLAGATLALSQWVTSALGGDYWGAIPTVLITAACAYISLKLLRQKVQ